MPTLKPNGRENNVQLVWTVWEKVIAGIVLMAVAFIAKAALTTRDAARDIQLEQHFQGQQLDQLTITVQKHLDATGPGQVHDRERAARAVRDHELSHHQSSGANR